MVECSDIWDKNMYLQDIQTFCHYPVQKLKRKVVTEWKYDIWHYSSVGKDGPFVIA